MSFGFALRIASLVLFIIAALLAFGLGSESTTTIIGLTDCGLGAWVASTLVP